MPKFPYMLIPTPVFPTIVVAPHDPQDGPPQSRSGTGTPVEAGDAKKAGNVPTFPKLVAIQYVDFPPPSSVVGSDGVVTAPLLVFLQDGTVRQRHHRVARVQSNCLF